MKTPNSPDVTNEPAASNGGSQQQDCCAAACLEIKEAIIWYEKHGYDWLSVVGYLSAKANGFGPPWIVRTRIGMSGRKRRHNDRTERQPPGTAATDTKTL